MNPEYITLKFNNTIWTIEDICKLLKSIEDEEGVIGFRSIYFEVDEKPIIKIMVDTTVYTTVERCSDCGRLLSPDEMVECSNCLDQSYLRATSNE